MEVDMFYPVSIHLALANGLFGRNQQHPVQLGREDRGDGLQRWIHEVLGRREQQRCERLAPGAETSSVLTCLDVWRLTVGHR